MSILPKKIQDSVRKAAKYHEKARKHQEEFEAWIKENYGEDILDENCFLQDVIIDHIEQSNNPETAIVIMENTLDDYEKIKG